MHTLYYRKSNLYSIMKCSSPICSLCDMSLKMSSNPIASSLFLKYPLKDLSLEEMEAAEPTTFLWIPCVILVEQLDPRCFLVWKNSFYLGWTGIVFPDNLREWLGKSSFFTQGRNLFLKKVHLLKVQYLEYCPLAEIQVQFALHTASQRPCCQLAPSLTSIPCGFNLYFPKV